MHSWPDFRIRVYIRISLVYTSAPQIHSKNHSYSVIMGPMYSWLYEGFELCSQ